MLKITEFQIEEAIIHVLDTNCDEPILTESYLNLLNDDINMFLTKHIMKILKDEELSLGKFKGESNILMCVNKFFKDEINLLEVSKELSIDFFEIIKETGYSSSCDLLFLKLKTEFGYGLCMIKLDYMKNYIHKIDYVEDKMKIDIIPQFVSLPNNSQKVMKSVMFVNDLHNEFTILYLNKSQKNSTEESNYFLEDFLRCSKVYSDYFKTKDFLSAAEKWTRKNIKDDASKAYFIRETIRDKFTNEENLNINQVARDIFKDDKDDIEKFVDFVELNGIEGELVVNKEYVDKKYERIRLKIDKDIDLYINRDSFYDINRFEVKRNGDGSLNMIIKYVLNYNEK